jgi:biopolymer transport protein ExbD
MFFIQMNRHTQHGLQVSVPRINATPPSSLDGLSAPLIFLDAKGRVFLNHQATTWDDLPAGLDRTLAQLPVRVVYFDASPNIPFYDAAHAIDIIEGRSAHAILLTPNSKSRRNQN